jgi:hypothetical protein
MVTPKGGMSPEGELLKFYILPYRCSIYQRFVTAEGSLQTFLAHARQSRPMAPAGLFVSQRTGSHSAVISSTTHEFFCPKVVLCGIRSETSVALSQLTQFWQIPKHRAVSYSLPTPCFVTTASSGKTCKYATASNTHKNLERFSTYWYAPSCCVCLGCCAAEFGSSGGTYELSCIWYDILTPQTRRI